MEQKWIIRIILKGISLTMKVFKYVIRRFFLINYKFLELKIGISEKSIFSLFHPDASNLFNVCSDLRKVCEDLSDPHTRLQISVRVKLNYEHMNLSKPRILLLISFFIGYYSLSSIQTYAF